jgi:hypothetical protein
MHKRVLLTWRDCLFLLGAIFFFCGCIATAHRSGRTLDPAQFSFSGSYLRGENIEESDADPVQFLALDARAGLARGLDMGIMHTWDITENNDNMFATYWGDFKAQLSNRDNVVGQPIFSLGLMKGYVYHEEAELHITSFPFMLSLPANEKVTPFFMYRYEKVSDDFIPEEFFEDERSTFLLGVEIDLLQQAPDRWMPKLGLSIGTYNSLMGGEGDRGLTLNLGLTVDSPAK